AIVGILMVWSLFLNGTIVTGEVLMIGHVFPSKLNILPVGFHLTPTKVKILPVGFH
ncbi:hypothetical protein Tco_1099300, partial [Tanacetum coccineum]